MAAGDLIVADYQYEYSGLLLGHDTEIIVKQVEGLYDLPEVRSSDVERQDGHGVWPGIDLMGPKIITITMELETETGSAGDWESLTRQLRAAFRTSQVETPFIWQRPNQGGKQFIMARCRKRSITNDWRASRGGSPALAMLIASDPRFYKLEGESLDTNIGEGNTSNTLMIFQEGNSISQPNLTITGPSLNPRVQNVNDEGKTLKMDVNLGAGQDLTVDMKNRIVQIDGVDRFDIVRADSDWWVLQPEDNEIVYTRSNTTAASSLTVEWQAASV